MPAAKPLQLILARQLASLVAMPILLIDADGTLVFYNEPAEALLNRRFDETGEIQADDLVELIEVADEDRRPLPPDERPTRVARLERRAVSRTVWTRSRGGEWKHLQVTAVPLVGEGATLFGVMHLLWEA
jgi:PAS domain-containing protein